MNFKFFKEKDNEDPFIYTEDQLMARLRFFIGICLALTLTGIVFVVLYSIIFVTQPLNAISPIDQKFFELIIPIATFLTGTLSGIMLAGNDKDAKMKALEAATRPTPVSPSPTSPAPTSFGPKPFSPAPMTPSFNAPASPFAATPTPTGPVTTGFGGKLAPPPAFEPEL
jgi:hypothetical protein